MALKFWNRAKKSFRDVIVKSLGKNEKAFIKCLHIQDFNSDLVVEIMHLATQEKSKFLYKKESWYTLPLMEQLSSNSKLHHELQVMKWKHNNGFYKYAEQANSERYITGE